MKAESDAMSRPGVLAAVDSPGEHVYETDDFMPADPEFLDFSSRMVSIVGWHEFIFVATGSGQIHWQTGAWSGIDHRDVEDLPSSEGNCGYIDLPDAGGCKGMLVFQGRLLCRTADGIWEIKEWWVNGAPFVCVPLRVGREVMMKADRAAITVAHPAKQPADKKSKFFPGA